MPTLDYGATFLETGVNNVKAHSWDDVLIPFQKVRTLLNTTGLDTANIQANGIRPADIRANTGLLGVRTQVYNDTGSTITAGSLVYMKDSETVSGETFPKVAKAIATTSVSTTYFAQAIVEADISNNTAGTVSLFSQIGSVNTSAGVVGDPVYLNTSVGGWTLTRPTGGNLVQVVGVIVEDHASTGKINFFLASFPDKDPTDTLSELGDTNITSAADASMLLYDTGTSKWIDNVMSGDATMADTGAVTLASSNTNLTSLANLATVGTVGTGAWAATDVAVSHGGTGASSASSARTNLGLAIGSDVQAYDAGLNSIAGLTTAANKMVYTSGSNTYVVADLSVFARTILDDSDGAAVRTTIGAQAAGSYQASDAGLTSIAGLTTAADKMIYTSGSDTYAVADLSSFARNILDDADAGAVRTTIGAQASGSYQTSDAGLTSIAGLTTAANKMIYTSGSDTYVAADLSVFARTILDDADAGAVRTTIGAQASGSYQTSDAGLTSIAGLTTGADKMIYTSGSDTYVVADLSSFARTILDDADAGAVRTTIGAQASGSYQASDAGLTSIAGLTTAADKMIYTSGSDTYVVTALSSFARTILDDADAAAVRATIGAGDSSASAFTDLSDVGSTTATAGRLMVADGDSWESVAVSGDVALASNGAMTIQANSVALATDTTGNYVATVADAGNSHITVANSGAENAAVTLNITNNAVGIAELAGIARGKIIVGDSGGNPALLAAGDNGHILQIDGSGDAVWAAAAAGGIASVVADTTPQLGGDLDINGNDIVSDSGNENISITPHGTGSVVLSKVDIGGGAIDGTIIGAASTAAISGTTGTFSGAVSGSTLAGTVSTAAQNSITSASSLATVGTITAGAWESSTVVASAYLDADTAHLTGTQTFSGAKTLSVPILSMHIGATTQILVDGSTTWSMGWWKSDDDRWWLLGNTAGAASFSRANAEFYIPTGNITDVPAS